MRHVDRRLGLAAVAIVCLQAGAGLTVERQAASQGSQVGSRLLAQTPPPAFDLKDFDFWASQCRSFSSEKLYPEALEACEKAIPLNTEKDKKKQQQQTLDLWKLRSHALFQLGRYQEAIGSYDYVLGLQPAYSLGLTNRCDALARLGRYDAAIASCDQALRLDGDWGDSNPTAAVYRRGTTLRKAGKLEAAIAAYEQALVANPDDVTIVAEHCDAVTVLKQVQTDALVQLRTKAKDGAAAGNPTAASSAQKQIEEQIKALDAALKTTEAAGNTCTQALEAIDTPAIDASKPPAQALYKRGLVFKRQQRFAEAQASFKAAASVYEHDLAANPNDPSVWTHQGMALEQLYQDARALTAYEKAVQLRPTLSLALVNQCGVLNRLRRFQAALTACDAALKGDGLWEDSRSAAAWSQRSSALLGVKQYEDAVASAERAIALNPGDAEAYNYKAVGLWYLKDYAEAEQAAQTATALDPHYPQAFATLGKILNTQGEKSQAALHSYQQALQVYEAAIAQAFKPENPLLKADILINLAVTLLYLERPKDALPLAKQASQVNPQSFEIQLNTGIIALKAKVFSDALDAFQKANQLSPNNLYVLTGQGQAMQGQADTDLKDGQKMEKYKQSIATLRVALSINPNYEPARQSYREVNDRMKQLQLRSQPSGSRVPNKVRKLLYNLQYPLQVIVLPEAKWPRSSLTGNILKQQL